MSKSVVVLSLLILLCCIAMVELIVSHSAHGASFDCSLAKSNIEKLICANPELSNEDEELSKTFYDMKRKAQRPDLLTKDQLEWLKHRNACKDKPCLLGEYKSRNKFVSNWLEHEKQSLPKADGAVQCTERPECWPEGSAMHTGLKFILHLKEASTQLEKKYDTLITILSSSPDYKGEIIPDDRVISALKAQEITWVKYRVDECELIGSLTGAGGTWPSTYANECEVNLTEERLRRVSSAIQCIQEIPIEKRWVKQADCLQQLAPLANATPNN